MRIGDLIIPQVNLQAVAKKSLLWSTMLLFTSFLLPVQRASAGDALNFFKNYFVTGDYAVGGIGIRGQGVTNTATQTITGGVSSYATGVIHMSGVPGYVENGVPQHADIVAAYLYWETIASPTADPALLAKGTFRGLKIVGTQIAPSAAQACWSSGGGNGNQSGAQRLLVYRADVLRYLPYAHDATTGGPVGQRLVNDADLTANGFALHTVSLPDSGSGGTQSPSSGNQAFLTEGASLVVVYRIAGAPLKAVIDYDGGYTFSSINPLMTQAIQGFYEASKVSPVGKMTHIVGDGDSNFKEQLTVNGSVPTGVSSNNPFQGALGSSWDNLTFSVSNLMSGDDSLINTKVTPSGPSSVDCLSWGAILFSTTVQDTDGDGLLDSWEKNGYTDINTNTFVNLPAMGANSLVKDIFLDVDYMTNIAPAHSHLPTLDALQKVASAFSAQGIKVHYDVGNNYQPGAPATPITPIPTFIISVPNASGGTPIVETACGAAQSPTCLFPAYSGTVSWKTGFEGFKNTYFSRARKDSFHYALFAHALALPTWRINDKSLTNIVVVGGLATATTQISHMVTSATTMTVYGAPAASGLNGTYQVSVGSTTTLTFPTTAAAGTYKNWGLSLSNGVPRSNSGVSDIGGGDLMVTLGLWDNNVGSSFMQASTFMHELGHNLDLGHGGDISDPTNCKPNYQSTMSYLFQVGGLLDPTGAPHIDYSHTALSVLNEGNLSETPSGFGAAALSYVPRWYARAGTSFLSGIIAETPVTKHCDGTPVLDPLAPKYVRLDGNSLIASPLDWNGDGVKTGAGLALDINFDGTTAPVASTGFLGFNDWLNINLQQVGARRSASGDSLDIVPGEDTGDDNGIAGGDLGIAGGDLGIAGGDLGIAGGDLGIAGGDLGIAGGDLGIAGGDLGGELTYEGAKSVGSGPSSLAGTSLVEKVGLTWAAPSVGSATQYQVWRATCPRGTTTSTCALSPTVTPVRIALVSPTAPLCNSIYNYCDQTTKDGVLYIYFVTATIDTNQTGGSNQVTLGELPERHNDD
ncbi:MAG: hypothetical protein LAO19_12000 [Acidobacteriia bacterium]|nr:hypothetical protein [Terriglobia bacterium]